MEARDLQLFSGSLNSYFTNLGFTMVSEPPVYIIEQVVFCQCQPVYDGAKYVMVRDPRVAIAKDATILTDIPNRKVFQRWASAVGAGGTSMTGGIPVWDSFYSLISRLGNGLKPLTHMTMQTGMAIMGRGMTRVSQIPSEDSRVSFYRAFGTIPEAQLAIERSYNSTVLDYVSNTSEFIAMPL